MTPTLQLFDAYGRLAASRRPPGAPSEAGPLRQPNSTGFLMVTREKLGQRSQSITTTSLKLGSRSTPDKASSYEPPAFGNDLVTDYVMESIGKAR
jgi:hypothetical protein